MHPVGTAGEHVGDVFAQTGEVGRENRRGNDGGQHGSVRVRLSGPSPSLDLVIGGIDFTAALLGFFAQFGRGSGEFVGVVLRHQPAIGLVDFGLTGIGRYAEHPIGRGARGDDPVSIKRMSDHQANQPTRRVPAKQQHARDKAE